MQDVICPLCDEVVDTIEDTEYTNSRDHQRPGQRGLSWEVRGADGSIVRENRLHQCAS